MPHKEASDWPDQLCVIQLPKAEPNAPLTLLCTTSLHFIFYPGRGLSVMIGEIEEDEGKPPIGTNGH